MITLHPKSLYVCISILPKPIIVMLGKAVGGVAHHLEGLKALRRQFLEAVDERRSVGVEVCDVGETIRRIRLCWGC
jgi:hypothetical protein